METQLKEKIIVLFNKRNKILASRMIIISFVLRDRLL